MYCRQTLAQWQVKWSLCVLSERQVKQSRSRVFFQVLRATEHIDFELTEFLMMETSEDIVSCYPVNQMLLDLA